MVAEQIKTLVDRAETGAREIRSDAERDADATRREARESAGRLLESLDALERPLGELVATIRRESDRLVGRLGPGTFELAHESIAQEPEPRALEGGAPDPEAERLAPWSEPSAADEPATEQEDEDQDELAQAEAEVQTEKEPAQEEPAQEELIATGEPGGAQETQAAEADDDAELGLEQRVVAAESATENAEEGRESDEKDVEPAGEATEPEAREEVSAPRRGVWARLRGGKGVFISEEGRCAVCDRGFMAGSRDELAASGWRVIGDTGLCPSCQGDGWQLPEGGGLPFRGGTD